MPVPTNQSTKNSTTAPNTHITVENAGKVVHNLAITGTVPAGTSIPARDLVTVVGNLVDNAFDAVALAEAGGTAPEIAAVELEHLDLDNGVVHFTGKAARTNRIPPEAHEALCRALDEGAAVGQRITVTDALDANKAARSVTQELSEVIRDAGLARVSRVAGASIRLHHALRHFHDGGIGDAVRFLGAVSVDTTMRSLGLSVDDL